MSARQDVRASDKVGFPFQTTVVTDGVLSDALTCPVYAPSGHSATGLSDERPLHPDEDVVDDEGWWACSEPERPYDEDCIYEERCPRCILKAKVDLAHGAEDDNLCDVQTGEPTTFTEMFAEFEALSGSGRTIASSPIGPD